jgi:hypothetical protein
MRLTFSGSLEKYMPVLVQKTYCLTQYIPGALQFTP